MLGTEEVTPDWWGGDGVLRPRWTTAGPGVRAAGDVSPDPQLQKGRTGHRGGGGEAEDAPSGGQLSPRGPRGVRLGTELAKPAGRVGWRRRGRARARTSSPAVVAAVRLAV